MYMMQGDRTFDNYFGTYPGADGLPKNVCQELSVDHPKVGCVKPFVLQTGSPASLSAGPSLVNRQRNNGLMNRFVAAFHAQGRDGTVAMGHYDATALPFYWSVAQNYVLFDKYFSSSPLGVQSNRSYWVAGASTPLVTVDNQPTIFDRLQAAGVSWKFSCRTTSPKRSTERHRQRIPIRSRWQFRC